MFGEGSGSRGALPGHSTFRPECAETETLGGGCRGAKGLLRASPSGLSGQDWRGGRGQRGPDSPFTLVGMDAGAAAWVLATSQRPWEGVLARLGMFLLHRHTALGLL